MRNFLKYIIVVHKERQQNFIRDLKSEMTVQTFDNFLGELKLSNTNYFITFYSRTKSVHHESKVIRVYLLHMHTLNHHY